MEKISKKILGIICTIAIAVASMMPTTVFVKGAASDLILDGAKNFGNVGEYAYNYVWFNDTTTTYKYMIITYTGDITNLRLQGVKSDKRVGKIEWVDQTQPDCLTLVGNKNTSAGKTGAVLVIDLIKSGFNTRDMEAVDMHYGPGTLNIGRVRLSTSSKVNANVDIMPNGVSAPKKTKVLSAKKVKGKNKVKMSIKQVKGAKGYIVQFSTSKNFKKILAVKNVKKTSETITRKSFKNKKQLYVRVKAYKLNVQKRIWAKKWSTVKKVKF